MININRLEQLNNSNKERQSQLLHHKFYSTFMVDVDSCLTGVEGIDELGKMYGIEKVIRALTRGPLDGNNKMTFTETFPKRLNLIRPKEEDIKIEAQIYLDNIIKDVFKVFQVLRSAGVDIRLLSAGFKNAMDKLAEYLRIPLEKIYANTLLFDENGNYMGFDETNPLCREGGKKQIIENLLNKKEIESSVAIIGDSVSELETEPETDFRIGFGGFVSRERVVKEADIFLTEPTFAPLILLLLDPPKIRKIFYEQLENREILIKAFNSMRGVLFNDRAKLLQQSIMELYEEFVFYAKNVEISNS